MNVVPCLTWVRRGVSKSVPDRVKLDKDELKRIIEETKEKIDDQDIDEDEEDDENIEQEVKQEVEGATSVVKQEKHSDKISKRKHDDEEEDDEIDDIAAKYGLDDYDADDDGTNYLHGIGYLACHADEEDDPYITLKGEESDEDDFEIKATDNLIVAGRAKKDVCSLEIHVYNEDLGNLYVHHDILLSSFPLAVEWLNFDIGEEKPGSFVAVGSMEPIIEIWDLDVVDSIEPVAVLGAKVKKKNKKKGSSGHTDAILDLSWNSNARNVLASASADFTVGIWDLSQGKIVTSIKQFKEKVQCVKWHPFEAQSLLAGSFDNTVKVFDCRSPNETYKSWNVGGEVERILWDVHSPLNFFATTDKGLVYYVDSRKDKPVFTLSAHNEAVTGICQSSHVPGLLVTTSTDHTFKVWDIQNNKPSSVLDRDLKLGQLQSLGACPEAPFVFAIGGEQELKVWDIRESAAVRRHFYSRAPANVTMETTEDAEKADDVTASAMETLSIDSESQQTSKKHKKKKNKKKENTNVDSGASAIPEEFDIDTSLQQNEEKKKKKKKKKKKQENS